MKPTLATSRLPAVAPLQQRAQPVAGSFRDPSGWVYRREGILYRQVNQCYAEDYRRLMESGLYRRLVEDGLLIPHEESHERPLEPDAAHCVIRPREVPLVSYPYEWCFSQLQDAALATLRIQLAALEHGLTLKDASSFNIQFVDGRPLLIDTLSFEAYQEGRPWVAYRQFCQHFLAPLALMAHVDCRLSQLLWANLDGVPLDLASRLLPWHTRLRPGLLLHLHAHARMLKKHSSLDVSKQQEQTARKFSRRSLEAVLESLESTTRRLRWRAGESQWADYYTSLHNYSGQALSAKEAIVRDFLEVARPRTVWDLGGNDGRFSRLAVAGGAHAVCWDIDPVCVERNYRTAREDGQEKLLPLMLDLTNPTPAVGWAHQERQSLVDRGGADVALALGLLHHLAVGNNVPWSHIAQLLGQIGQTLIVEWVPREDSQVQRLLSVRRDIFTDYTQEAFEKAFARQFNIQASITIPDSTRVVYLMTRREDV